MAALCITALAPGSEASPEESQEWVFTPARVMMSYDAAGNRVLRQVVKQQIQFTKKISYRDGHVGEIAHYIDDSLVCREVYGYTLGTLTSITTGGGATIWRLQGEDGQGRPVAVEAPETADSLEYDIMGRLVRHKAMSRGSQPVYDHACAYTADGRGNMAWRADRLRGMTEDFSYDGLDRLTGWGGNTATYGANGNITDRDPIGKIRYWDDRPYALRWFFPDPSVPGSEQRIAYDGASLPDSISEGGCSATFIHMAGQSRRQMTLTMPDGTVMTTTYRDGGNYQRTVSVSPQGDRSVSHVLWLGGSSPYDAPAAMVSTGGGQLW